MFISTAISKKVVGKKALKYTREDRKVVRGRSRELLHVLNTNVIIKTT